MTDEHRSVDRRAALAREEWITKFVNTIVRELRISGDRMAVVAAARNTWSAQGLRDPREAAQAWWQALQDKP